MTDLFQKLAAPFPPDRVSAFESKVFKSDSCWIWKASKNSRGYGNFWHEGKSWKAHRFSYAMYCGSIPEGMDILHSCDNPSCVNPEHLRAGTHLQNMHDMISRGRSPDRRGENNGKSRLTRFGVQYIRDMYAFGFKTPEIAKKFNINPSTVRRIVTHRYGGWSAQ